MSTAARTPPPHLPLAQAPKALNWDRPTTRSGLEEFVPLIRGQISRAMPSFLKGQADRMIRCLFTCCQTTPALLECAPVSLFGGLIQAAQLGLELGGPLGQAYLLPFGNTRGGVKNATFVLGYKGALNLAFRSNMLASMPVARVREGEHFEAVEGSGRKIIHTRRMGGVPSTKVLGYYVIANLVNGGQDFEYFSYEEAVEFRDRYASTRNAPPGVRDKSPWYDTRPGLSPNGFDWMAIKTLIKRVGKRLPLSVEFQTATGLDDMADADVPQQLERLVDAARPASAEDDLRRRLDEAKAPPKADDPPRRREPGDDDLYEDGPGPGDGPGCDEGGGG